MVVHITINVAIRQKIKKLAINGARRREIVVVSGEK